jgi:predicted PurR-regulated permease PerM
VAVSLLFLWQVSDILAPFVWAIITVYVFNPLLNLIARRTGLPRRLCAILSFILLLALLALGISVIIPVISSDIQQLIQALPELIRQAGKLLGQTSVDIFGITINLTGTDEQINRQLGQILMQVGRNFVPTALPRIASSLLHLLLYLVATFLLLLEADRIGPSIERYTPTALKSEFGPLVARINNVLGAYIRAQLFLVVLMSVVSFIALTVLGVRFAPLLAIFTGLVETMPFVGPYVAGGVAVIVALTQGTNHFGWPPMQLAIAVAITYTVLRQIEDNFVMPLVVGKLVRLHPLVIIFSVLAGASLIGILGLLLAVPVAATLKIVAIYLYRKFNEQPPPRLVLIEEDNDWDIIAARVREGMSASLAEGASRPRILLSIPVPPPALLDIAQFHRLPALLQERNADAAIFTKNIELIALAQSANIPVQSSLEQATAAEELPELEEENRVQRRSAIRKSQSAAK